MKAFFSPLVALAMVLGGTALGQELVSTGIIAGLQPKEGTVTIRSDQTNGMITFFGADKANIFTSDGQPYVLQNLTLGTKVTIQYASRGEKWYVSKMILPPGVTPSVAPGTAPAGTITPTPAAGTAPQAAAIGGAAGVTSVVVEPSRLSKAANDGDITTKPANSAAFDHDITTKPPRSAATDGDITTKPPNSAATDGDITTRPGNSAARPNDITVKPPRSAATDNDITTVPPEREVRVSPVQRKP